MSSYAGRRHVFDQPEHRIDWSRPWMGRGACHGVRGLAAGSIRVTRAPALP